MSGFNRDPEFWDVVFGIFLAVLFVILMGITIWFAFGLDGR